VVRLAKYIPLHVHTHDSLLDGMIRSEEYIKKVKEMGMEACAITDHGVMGGVPNFYKKCREEKIKPIIGFEAYVVDNINVKDRDQICHLVLLAKNLEGYRNLVRLTSLGHIKGFYYKPRLDFEMLKQYKEGIIALSACVAGHIPRMLLNGDFNKAQEYVNKYLDIFRDDFYIEVQNNGLSEQAKVLPYLYEIADRNGIPIVATTDAHYLSKEDAEAHRVLLCIQVGKTLEELEEGGGFEGFWSSDQFYVLSPEEMESVFKNRLDALDNTLDIANKCNLIISELEETKYRFPKFSPPKNLTADQYLRRISKVNLVKKYLDKPNFDEYYERMSYELDIISKLGFSTYFLVLRDIIKWAKKQGIRVGKCRGSAGGCLVSDLVGITDIDPIEFNLIFERFLNPDRVSLPDIDVDIADDRRHEVIEYLYEKYGRDKVCHIGTFGTLSLKAVIKDVARTLGYDFSKINKFTKNLPDEITLNDLREYDELPFDKKVIDYAAKLEGLKRHDSAHAAGVIISPVPITDYVPLRVQEGEIVSQLDMHELELIGFVKFDLLGLRTLSVIENTVQLIKENRGIDLDIDNIPLDDEKTWTLFRYGKTTGVFQVEKGIRGLLTDMQASQFSDLVAALALYRPGPLSAKDEDGKTMVEHYIDRKLGKEKITYDHPKLEPILKETYGIIVYQEQVMNIARVLAGYTNSEADTLRKVVGKKLVDKIPEQREKFISGCIKNGVKKEIAENIFSKIEGFGRYGFNLSHSTGYALISYQTAYLKANYPIEYMCALISSVAGDKDKIKMYLKEAQKMGVVVLPPDINKSQENFTLEDGVIRFGFCAVKNFGKRGIKQLMEIRKDGPIESLKDFLLRIKDSRSIDKKAIESLIKVGAFDGVEKHNRRTLLENLPALLELIKKMKGKIRKGFSNISELHEPIIEYKYEIKPEYSSKELRKMEKEIVKVSLKATQVNLYTKNFRRFKIKEIRDVYETKPDKVVFIAGAIDNFSTSTIKKKGKNYGKEMAIFELTDNTGSIKCIAFPDQYKKYKLKLKEDNIILIKGVVKEYNAEKEIYVNKVQKLKLEEE